MKLVDMPMNYIGKMVALRMKNNVTVWGQLQRVEAKTVIERSICSNENWVDVTGEFEVTVSGWSHDGVSGSSEVELV